MTAPITYTPYIIADPTRAFLALWNDLAWLRHDKVPRREYFVSKVGKPYAYGKAEYARTYEPQPAHSTIAEIWAECEKLAGCKFDVCFLNGYEDRKDQLGWHADDSPEMDDARPIAVVSLMAVPTEARELWFMQKGVKESVEKHALGSGSCVMMAPGMQDTHLHRIPKASFDCHARVSLTFRGYTEVAL